VLELVKEKIESRKKWLVGFVAIFVESSLPSSCVTNTIALRVEQIANFLRQVGSRPSSWDNVYHVVRILVIFQDWPMFSDISGKLSPRPFE